ncbi:MAG: BatD family protein [Saprospiraceae bacterium]|nr:BatD family protein [Saprospiraceae bacterium]
MKKILILIFSFGVLVLQSQSATVSIAVSRDTVLLGNQFYVQYTFDSKDGVFIAPDLKDAEIIGQNFVSNTSLINGEIKAVHKQKYLIQPLSAGLFTIPSTMIKSGDRSGGDLDVPAVEIYVKQNPNRIEEDPEDDRSWQFKNILEGKASGRKSKRL